MFRKIFIHFFEAFSPLQDLSVWVVVGCFPFPSRRLVIDLGPGQPGPELDFLMCDQGYKQFLVVGQIIDIPVS